MKNYETVQARSELYAQVTGLSRRTVNQFRNTVVSEWTHRSDRRIGRAIRGLERLWRDPGVTVKLWLRTARGVLGAVHDFLDDVVTTVEELGVRIASAIERALLWVERTAERVETFIKRYPRLERVLSFIASTVGPYALDRAARRLVART